jgi:glucokinase
MIIEDMKTRVVGVDIKLHKTTCAIVDVRGNIIVKDSFPTTDYPNIGDFVSKLCEHILTLVEANGGYESVRSVGISAPSGNFPTGSIVNSPNMPWKGVVPLAAMLRDRLGIAVALANNAYVTALGEYVFGAAHGLHDFAVLSVGSGVGSCFYSQGRVHLGTEGFAGEVGHTCMVPNGRQCGCGNRGCLEAYCSEKGVATTAREMMEESSEPSLLRDLETVTADDVLACCAKGDKMAIEVFRRTGKILGLALANYASVIDPEAFIFTGGISKAGHWLLEPAEEEFEKHVYYNIRGKVKFLVSMLDDRERDVLGASVLAWEIKEYSLFK